MSDARDDEDPAAGPEPVVLSSLDADFERGLRAVLAGPALEPAGPGPTRETVEALLAFVRERFGLESFGDELPAATETGGVRALARNLFVSKTYHASLFTLLERIATRQDELTAHLEAVADDLREHDETLGRTFFHLFGDYNNLVRSVLHHHVNEVFPDTARRVEQLRGIPEAVERLERTLNDIQGPHDDLVRTTSELLGARVREEALARRVEDLEDRLAVLERAGRAAPDGGAGEP